MRIEEFAEQFKQKTGRYKDWSDVEIVRLVKEKKPALLNKIDKYDLEDALKTTQAQRISQQRRKTFKTLSGISRFGIGVEHGIADTFMGVMQLFSGSGKLSGTGYSLPGQESVPHEGYERYKQEYKEASEGDKAAGAGEIAGSLVATAPIPGATGAKLAGKITGPLVKDGVKVAVPLGKRLLASGVKAGTAAGIGAGYGAGEYVDEDETRLKNTVYGALFGAGGVAGGLLLKKLGTKGYNAVKGKMEDASVQEMFDLFKKHDIPWTKSMLTGGEGAMTEKALAKIPGVGLGGHMQRGAQQTGKTIQKMSDKIGVDWDETIQESLQNKAKIGKAKAKVNYGEVEKFTGGVRYEPVQTIKKIDQVLSKFDKSKTPKQNPAIKYLQETKENLQAGKSNYSELRATREALGKDAADFSLNNPTASKMLGSVKKTIEKDMDEAINAQVEMMTKRTANKMQKLAGGPGSYNPYGAKAVKETAEEQIQKGENLKKAYKKAREEYIRDVVPYKNTKIIADLKTDTPDEIYKKYIKRGSGDKARNFYNLLDKKGKKALRDGFLDNAITRENGEFNTPALISSYLDRMTKPGESIFKGEALKELKDFAKIMRHTKQYGQLNEAPSTGFGLIPILKGSATGIGIASGVMNPVATTSAIVGTGLLTKLSSFMKTKGARYSLASSKIGSKEFEKTLEKFMKQLSKASAVTGKEIGE